MRKTIQTIVIFFALTAIIIGCNYPEMLFTHTAWNSNIKDLCVSDDKVVSSETTEIKNKKIDNPKQENRQHTQVSKDEPQVSQEPSQVNKDESQVSQEPSQVNKDESQVSQELPQVNKDESQVSQELPQVSKDEPQVSQEPPQVSKDEPQISEEPPQVSKDEPQISEELPQVSNDEPQTSQEPTQVSNDEPPVIPDFPIVNVYDAYTSEKVYGDIDKLCERYPELITQSIIGQSAKSKPIVCVTLGKGGKKACIVAGIHSREHITISFTMRCIEEYAEAYINNNPYGDYDIRELLDQYTLYLIPMCNPDGTDISVAGEQPLAALSFFEADSYKLNANGVNLNRNFPFNWEEHFGKTSLVPGDEIYAGEYAGSENETKAIIKLCSENDFLWLFDMHIIGNGIYWRDQKNGIIENDWHLASSVAQKCGYIIFDNTTDPAEYSGGLENWFRYAFGKPSLCIEMIPYSQAYYSDTYFGYNSFFEEAVNWSKTKYTYLEAMNCMK